MRLLNQNIKLVPNADDTAISIINMTNNMELGTINSKEPMEIWINEGYFMNKKEYIEYLQTKVDKLKEEILKKK